MLGQPDYHRTIVCRHGDAGESVALFARLLALPDDRAWDLFAFALAESLEAGSALVDAVGIHQGLDPKDIWTPDETFFDLMRDREVANRMVAEVAGKGVADSNATEKVRTQKAIIRDCLAGAHPARGRGLGAALDAVPRAGLHQAWRRALRRSFGPRQESPRGTVGQRLSGGPKPDRRAVSTARRFSLVCYLVGVLRGRPTGLRFPSPMFFASVERRAA